MNRRFWSGKRAFVTGHTGFKGGWLCAWLLDAGAHVAGYALAPPSERSIFTDAALGSDMTSTIADIRDSARLGAALRASNADVVFHLAAQSLVRTSYDLPIDTYSINVLGTAHLLDAVRAAPSVRTVVVVTSDKCYDPALSDRRHAEDDPLGGNDPYSASKAAAELVAASYRSSYFDGVAGVATARAGNVIGGGDWAKDRLLPDLLRAFGQARHAEIRRPDAIRPWQHVLDPIEGYLRLAEALHDNPKVFASAWNFGPPPEHEVAVAALADIAKRLWGSGANWMAAPGRHPPETPVLRLDSTKAARALRWRARVPLESAVGWTVEWERSRSDGTNVRELLRRDFARFDGLAP
jgi:CDP-glucose 4,6-dehydratase